MRDRRGRRQLRIALHSSCGSIMLVRMCNSVSARIFSTFDRIPRLRGFEALAFLSQMVRQRDTPSPCFGGQGRVLIGYYGMQYYPLSVARPTGAANRTNNARAIASQIKRALRFIR